MLFERTENFFLSHCVIGERTHNKLSHNKNHSAEPSKNLTFNTVLWTNIHTIKAGGGGIRSETKISYKNQTIWFFFFFLQKVSAKRNDKIASCHSWLAGGTSSPPPPLPGITSMSHFCLTQNMQQNYSTKQLFVSPPGKINLQDILPTFKTHYMFFFFLD